MVILIKDRPVVWIFGYTKAHEKRLMSPPSHLHTVGLLLIFMVDNIAIAKNLVSYKT